MTRIDDVIYDEPYFLFYSFKSFPLGFIQLLHLSIAAPLIAVENDVVDFDVFRQHFRNAYDMVVVDMGDDEQIYFRFKNLLDKLPDGLFIGAAIHHDGELFLFRLEQQEDAVSQA